MARPTHAKLRGGTYYWRRKVPLHLIARFAVKEFSVTLRTGEAERAAIRARRLTVICDRLFAMAERDNTISNEQLAALAREWFRREAANEQLDDVGQELGYAAIENGSRIERRIIELAEDSLRRRELDGAIGPAMELLDGHGLKLAADSPQFRLLCHYLLRAYAELAKLRLARLEGDFSASPTDPLFTAPSAPITSIAQPAPPSPTFSVLTKRYEIEMSSAGAWTGQTTAQNRASYRWFTEILGDKQPSAYTRRDVSRFKEQLEKLPARYGQRYKGMAIDKLIETAERTREPRLTSRTIERHLAALSGFFDWSKQHGYGPDENPATGFRAPKVRRAREARPAWTPRQLQVLFSSPLYTGCKSIEECSRPGSLIPRDSERFWVPLLGAFSGARAEELCQLRVKDIQQRDGIWVLDIGAGEGRKLKSQAAIRVIPLHKAIIAAGFLSYVDRIRKAGHDRLFPALKPGGADKKLSFYFSKWFSRYRRTLRGCEGRDFHALRGTFKTELAQQGVPKELRDEVCGHEHAGMDEVYLKGFPLVQLRDAVNKVRYGDLDLSHLTAR